MIWIKRAWLRFARFCREITTGRDNESADIVRVMGISLGVQFMWLAGVSWAKFSPIEFATGAGLIIGTVAGAMRVARPTEPTNKE